MLIVNVAATVLASTGILTYIAIVTAPKNNTLPVDWKHEVSQQGYTPAPVVERPVAVQCDCCQGHFPYGSMQPYFDENGNELIALCPRCDQRDERIAA